MHNAKHMGGHSSSGPILHATSSLIVLIAGAVFGMLLFSSEAPAGSFWHRSDLFWRRLAWFEIIVAVMVIPAKGLLSFRRKNGGGLPAMLNMIAKAARISLALLFVTIFLPESRIYTILPIVIQIAIAVACLMGIVLVKRAEALQSDGLDPIPATLKAPEELCTLLTIREAQPGIEPGLARKLKRVRERIKYSVPKAGKVASSIHYQSVVLLVDAACGEMMSGNPDGAQQHLDSLDNVITLLINDCKN